jgi:hypothetical protein
MRYNFKPQSAATADRGKISKSLMSLETKTETCTFTMSEHKAKDVEMVMVYDSVQKCFNLHKLSSLVTLTHQKNTKKVDLQSSDFESSDDDEIMEDF